METASTRMSTIRLAMMWALLMPIFLLAEEPSKTPIADPVAPTEWKTLCDGKSLKDWSVAKFGGEGAVESTDGAIVMQQGSELTGIQWIGAALPKKNYEIALEAKRIDGSDFFCGIVFPIGEAYCSFVVGGWGGGTVGLSAIDGLYADNNETTTSAGFDDKRWYKIRLRVSEKFIQSWIDNKRAFKLDTTGKKLTVHHAVEILKPFGVSCYATVAAVRKIRIRDLSKEEAVEVPKD